MEYITLKDIAIINMGQSPDSKTYNEEKEGIPFYQGKSDFGKINPIPRVWCSNPIKIAEKEDILISVRAPIGDTNIATERCCIGRGLASIRPLNENVNQKYLYYLLNSKYKELNKFGTGSTFKAITKDNLCNLKCTHIPDIKEQIEVVNKLDNVSKIIAIKKEQLEQLNTIIKSQFVEMFERGQYPKDEFINIAKEIYAGGDKPKDISKVQDDEYLYPVFANGYENEGLQGYSKSYRTGDNAVTISARGTIGYSFIRNEKFTPIVRLITIIPNEKANVVYLKYAIDNLNIAGSGTSQAQLTVPDIKKKKITIPPIELQNQFADIVKQIDKQKFEIENSLKEMQELYESLMEKYFG